MEPKKSRPCQIGQIVIILPRRGLSEPIERFRQTSWRGHQSSRPSSHQWGVGTLLGLVWSSALGKILQCARTAHLGDAARLDSCQRRSFTGWGELTNVKSFSNAGKIPDLFARSETKLKMSWLNVQARLRIS